MTVDNFYAWKCNRCDTAASGGYREWLQQFVDHHVATMHSLPAVEQIGRPARPVGSVQGSGSDD